MTRGPPEPAPARSLKLVTTSVVRGSHQGESHGGVYLIDLEQRDVRQVIDWNKADIDWQGRGWDRGLRGIAFDGEIVYIAASDELFAYTPDFRLLGSWRNPYLKHCHEIAVWERTLFLTSTGFDSILGFDLDRKEFTWAMHVETQQFRFKGRVYDPRKDDGPLMLNKLHLNNVHCTRAACTSRASRRAACCSSTAARSRWRSSCRRARTTRARSATACCSTTPRPTLLRYAGRGEGREDRALSVPRYPDEQLLNRDVGSEPASRARVSRAGSPCSRTRSWPAARRRRRSRSTTSPKNERLLSVNLTMDVRNAIHGLEVWPFD